MLVYSMSLRQKISLIRRRSDVFSILIRRWVISEVLSRQLTRPLQFDLAISKTTKRSFNCNFLLFGHPGKYFALHYLS